MSPWMNAHDELQQNLAGFSAHFAWGAAAVLAAAVIWGPQSCAWQWTFVGMWIFGVAWEIVGYFLSGRRWLASVLGIATFGVGAIAAAAIILAAGR